MTRLDRLIKELCPDGVEHVPLCDIARISNGKDHKALPDGNIPVYGSGGIMRYANQYLFDKESVLIPRKGSIGNIFYVDTPFWTVDTIFYTKIDIGKIVPKYFYYYLHTQKLEDMNTAGGVPSLTKSVLDKVKIALPPLPVQREIVRILDNFMELTAELTAELAAELAARKKQYEYYRDALLEQAGTRSKWMALGEVGSFIRGRRFTKEDYADEGIPCIHYGEIYTRYGVSADKTVSHLKSDIPTSLRYAMKGDVVLTDVSETVEDVGKAMAWLGDHDVAIHDHCYAYRHSLNPSFVAYYMQSVRFQKEKRRYVVNTKIKTLSMEGLARVKIPIPSIDEQNSIVSILDRFDALTADISNGLPAEIAARKKQYEHYRDKLLSFPEKQNTANVTTHFVGAPLAAPST